MCPQLLFQHVGRHLSNPFADFAVGIVNTADYIVWRNGGSPQGGTPAEYDAWKANFGTIIGSGSGSGGNVAVPEPSAILLIASLAIVGLGRPGVERREIHHRS